MYEEPQTEAPAPPFLMRLPVRWRESLGALALVAVATSATLALQIADIARTPLFLGAVVLCAAVGGARTGVVASLLAVAAIDLFIFEEPLDVSLRARRDLLLLVVFIGTATMMTVAIQWLHWRRRDAEQRASVAQAEAELAQRQVEQLRSQLQQLREVHDERPGAAVGMPGRHR